MKAIKTNIHVEDSDEFAATQYSNFVTLTCGGAVGLALYFRSTVHAKRVLANALTAVIALEEPTPYRSECQRFGDLGGYCPGDDVPPCPPCAAAAELANGA